MIGKNDQNAFDGFATLGKKNKQLNIHELWSSA